MISGLSASMLRAMGTNPKMIALPWLDYGSTRMNQGKLSTAQKKIRHKIFEPRISVRKTTLKTCFMSEPKNYQYSTEGQRFHENLALVLVIISWKSLVSSRKTITSTGFYKYFAPDTSARVVVINESPIMWWGEFSWIPFYLPLSITVVHSKLLCYLPA